jgi:hypothetical protein
MLPALPLIDIVALPAMAAFAVIPSRSSGSFQQGFMPHAPPAGAVIWNRSASVPSKKHSA